MDAGSTPAYSIVACPEIRFQGIVILQGLIMKVQKWKVIIWVIGMFTVLGIPMLVRAEEFLTPEEKAYIESKEIVKASAISGVAPMTYLDENGEIQGVAKSIFDQVSEMTGLTFSYELYDSTEETLASDYDIIFFADNRYLPEGMVCSRTYLRSEAILYLRSSLNVDELKNKRFAIVKGSKIPEGVNEERIIYYDSREDSIDAVASGEADYGYGNSYSVTYYTRKNNYKNIIIVPTAKETREYCAGFDGNDKILVSIINKSLKEIGEERVKELVLKEILQAEKKESFSSFIDSNSRYILAAIFSISVVLLLFVFLYARNHRILVFKSETDGLTQVYNAITVKELVSESIKEKRKEERIDALLILDCDDFKNINDTLGHLFGDRVLEQIGGYLKQVFGKTVIIGRIGGDEFLIYMKDIPSQEVVYNKCKELRTLLQSNEDGIAVTVSVGVTIIKKETDYEEAFQIVDEALYQAKRNGKDSIFPDDRRSYL